MFNRGRRRLQEAPEKVNNSFSSTARVCLHECVSRSAFPAVRIEIVLQGEVKSKILFANSASSGLVRTSMENQHFSILASSVLGLITSHKSVVPSPVVLFLSCNLWNTPVPVTHSVCGRKRTWRQMKSEECKHRASRNKIFISLTVKRRHGDSDIEWHVNLASEEQLLIPSLTSEQWFAGVKWPNNVVYRFLFFSSPNLPDSRQIRGVTALFHLHNVFYACGI